MNNNKKNDLKILMAIETILMFIFAMFVDCDMAIGTFCLMISTAIVYVVTVILEKKGLA